MKPERAILAVVALALVLAGCSPGATPAPSAGSSLAPSAAPSQGAVTTPELAATLVLASDPRFAGVGPVDPDLIGQSAWYTVDPASDGWTVVVTMGWGDCPSGCIEKHTWTYSVTTGGSVTLLAETGPSIPPEAIPAG